MNKVIIMGRLTRDPELRRTQNDLPVATFSIAVDRKGKKKQTDFIDCVAWRQTAEFVSQWFPKGKMISIVGSLQVRNWKDKEGNNRKAVEVVADEVYFCGDKGNRAKSDWTEEADEAEEYYEEESLPF